MMNTIKTAGRITLLVTLIFTSNSAFAESRHETPRSNEPRYSAEQNDPSCDSASGSASKFQQVLCSLRNELGGTQSLPENWPDLAVLSFKDAQEDVFWVITRVARSVYGPCPGPIGNIQVPINITVKQLAKQIWLAGLSSEDCR